MKRLLLIISAIVSLSYVQAQTKYQLKAEDIVTISRVNSNTRYYLTVNDNGEITMHNEPNDNSLWVINSSSYASNMNQYTFKHYKTGRYLYINGSKSGGWWNSNYTITFDLITDPNPSILTQDQPNIGENGVYEEGRLYYSYDNKTFYLSINNNNAWAFQQNVNQNLQVEKWEEQRSANFETYFSPETYDFGLIKDTDKDIHGKEITHTAIAQTKKIRLVIDLRDDTYYACLQRPKEKHLCVTSVIESDLNTLYNNYNIKPIFSWVSSTDTASTLGASAPDYYTYENEESRKMLGIDNSQATISSDKLAWEIPIRSYGRSPLNLRHTHNAGVVSWANYVDYLVATWTYNNQTYTATMRVARKSYHTHDLPQFEITSSPSTFTFDGTEGAQTFTITGIHQHGTAYYDVDEQIVDKTYTYGPKDIPLEDFDVDGDEENDLSVEFKCVELNADTEVAWLTKTAQSDNTITLRATANNAQNAAYRQARLHGIFTLSKNAHGQEDAHAGDLYIPINQRAAGGDNIAFAHYEGISYAEQEGNQLDNKGRQQVHTAERTIYYKSGQDIELRLAESNFFGYMRWYDYDSNGDGGDPYWNKELTKQTSWASVPRGANGTNFKAINTSPGNSRGLYGINEDPLNSENANNPAPIIRGWNYADYDPANPSDHEKNAAIHTIACDVSAYIDYDIQKSGNRVTSIKEPTLSYRQLFHLRPAEEIAHQLNEKSHQNPAQYLENYKYRAAVGADVHLATKYRYTKYNNAIHESELCYFFYNKKNELKRVGVDAQAKWYKVDENGQTESEVSNPEYQVYDYLNIDSDIAGKATYVLKVPKEATGNDSDTRLGYDLLIAKFTITFVNINDCGPRKDAIISDHEINQHFIPLKSIDFSFGQEAPGTSSVTQLDYHLPWDQSTYGYYYPKGGKYTALGETSSNRSGQSIPYYGEYFLVNKMDKDWAREEQHGGAANGYALYVDGTTEPGRVVSISTDAVICAGQTLYCSAWLCNPCPTSFDYNSPRNPIFRCNVEGRFRDINNNWSEWEDVSVFFVGQLPKESGWQQIVFPVESEKSYDETRVSIYNFATGGSGNDFMVDDITLFASRLPLASYQAQTSCASAANTTASTATILRIDYTKFNSRAKQYMYYQIYNNSTDQVIDLKEKDANDNLVSAYYHDDTAEKDQSGHGSVTIPDIDFDPIQYNKDHPDDQKLIFESVQLFKDYLVDRSKATDETRISHAKAYIQTTVDGDARWLLYVMHIIPNAAKDAANINENTHLREDYNYSLRMANVADELSAPECNMQTPLKATQATVFDLYNGEYEEENGVRKAVDKGFIPESPDNCANDLYTLHANIENLIAAYTGAEIVTARGEVMGDWLVGYPFDDVYTNTAIHLPNHQDSVRVAKEQFQSTYGYTREEVTTAILYDLRRQDASNTNLLVSKFEEIDANAFEHPHHYQIVKNLYENGFLELGKTKTSFYLASQDTARYWFYPIDGTATAIVKDQNSKDVKVTLHDCSEPIWVRVSTEQSDHHANLAPIEREKQSRIQKNQIPTVRVRQSQLVSGEFSIPITELANATTIADFAVDDERITVNVNQLGFVDDQCKPIAKPENFVVGEQYMVRIRMKQSSDKSEYIGGNPDNCRVGSIFLNILVLPDAVIWTPAEGSYNGWGLDENWRGWNDQNSNGVIDEGEQMTVGFVPIEGSDVIIPTLPDVTLYPYVHDHNHYPMDVNAHPSTCGKIHFEPGAHIHNQHLLNYEKAFVDMQITAGGWNMVSAPMKGMVSGDMFVPHNGMYYDNNPYKIEEPQHFDVSEFAGKRHTDAAYVFWQAFYNTTVNIRYEGYTNLKQASSTQFVQSNALNQELAVGSGYQLYGLGLQENELLKIRLPKPDIEYFYYTPQGEKSEKFDDVTNTEDNRHRLAYELNNSDENAMAITLTNDKAASEYFIFGNPTMAFIDMHALHNDNNNVWDGTYYTLQSNTWTAETPLTQSTARYLPPMTSVLLKVKADATDKQKQEMPITLKPEHLTLNYSYEPIDEQQNAPARRIAQAEQRPVNEDAKHTEMLTIYAFTNQASARTVLASNPIASDYYIAGEDALFTSTGIESQSFVTSPLNMYTVAEQVPMMADVRQGISEVPVAILAAEGYHTKYMQVAFYYTSNWSRTCYFCDTKTGQKIRIMDGLVISVEMPLNHEQRYYIEGPDTFQGSDGVTTSTTQPNVSTTGNKVWAYAPDRNTVVVSSSDLIKSATLYDLTGRLIAQSPIANSLITNSITLYTHGTAGLYLLEVTLRDNTKAQTNVLVK